MALLVRLLVLHIGRRPAHQVLELVRRQDREVPVREERRNYDEMRGAQLNSPQLGLQKGPVFNVALRSLHLYSRNLQTRETEISYSTRKGSFSGTLAYQEFTNSRLQTQHLCNVKQISRGNAANLISSAKG